MQDPGLLAEDFHEHWWVDAHFAESRDAHADEITARDSALKLEVAAYLAGVPERIVEGAPFDEELRLLREATIDGIITTNFDGLLETLRADLRLYVGQDELLFSDPTGIGEIYAIHGHHSQPDSLVLTAEDYERFDARNPTWPPKLLTIFVEHPVVFLGYSLTDRNVQRVLVDIARCLSNERIEALRDRLIFVNWSPDARPSMASTVISAEGFAIPVLSITAPEFVAVFTALTRVERRYSVRLLRHLREQVYELVRTEDPAGRVYVTDIAEDTDPEDIDVVLGVGAITKLTTSYVGLNRSDLLFDVLEDRGYDATRVVVEALPAIGRINVQAPVYKYLRNAGMLQANGSLIDEGAVSPKVVARVSERKKLLAGLRQYRKGAEALLADGATLSDLLEDESVSDDQLLYALPFIPEDRIELEALRAFLLDTKPIFDSGRQPVASQWAKAVCQYDWLRSGASG